MSESFEHDYRRLASEDIQLKESTNLSMDALKRAFADNLYHVQGKAEEAGERIGMLLI
ncbi:hypothetical protein Glo7428_1785 [Gloeocapsa sp. PCC 7428]|uniref:hypothetical protein n=1 Tax=Gloeocapsa sp. PCC 7428 TaxID=1173026 RepID=UPI0002A5E0CA|nr:hypothetical protein [Gloeocapsa sp. PCC 7428]AFZ30338.1 hypothetical protein Glo7428_1785 [Gloeocapsa sp. PCC 7428]